MYTHYVDSLSTGFRPLSGSYISQLNSHICSLNVCGLFPSPIGELHFSILDIRETERVEYTVSVPYRGATFLNSISALVSNDVSVFPSPIGELHFSIFLHPLSSECIFAGFPSPIGELHFSIPSPQPHVLSGTNRGIAGEK